MELIPGVYETLVSAAIERKLGEMPTDKYFIKKVDIDSAESCKMLSDYLADVVCDILKNYFRQQNPSKSISSQVEVVNRVLQFIESEWKDDDVITADFQISERSKLQFLRGIYSKVGYTDAQVEEQAKNHPISGYRVSSLFTGGNDISIDDEIKRDIQTADSIDFVVSFIKFEGIRLIYQDLKDFLARQGARLRILTTTYMGATDPKAIRKLFALKEFGDVQIRASFNNSQERLHAKAYIFYRNNGFDTAYIGSSNLSRSALTKGLEWNMRITSIENAHIINKTKATFDTYWNSDDFEALDSEEQLSSFEDAIQRHRHSTADVSTDESQYVIRFERKIHQIKVLEKLQFERNNVHSYKNLIIAATGTGKTAISAFDFKDFSKVVQRQKGRKARLLFIAHREKILKQARATFRSVMVDANFGEIWSGRTLPSARGNVDQLFITIQTLNNRWEVFDRLGKDYYDYIVIDEVHHSQAGSYRETFTRFSPEIFVGLTATPERMDGKEIKPDFNNRFAAEIRLQEALDQRLLSPFDYFCITDDSVDLSIVPCRGDTYDNAALTALYKAQNVQRFSLIQRALENYVTSPQECKAVCFCAGIEHAEMMAGMFTSAGYKAKSVTSRNSADIDIISAQLARGEINYLCVADILNEGIDIPEIDTVLFLRPTESLTVFLQQLGRGLRLADGKTCLTVLDFVAQANKSYNYERRFRALVGRTTKSIAHEIKGGFKFLPRGCSITMERQAQEYILQNIQNAIFNQRRLIQEVRLFEHNTGQPLTLQNFLDNFALDIRTIYKSPGSWTRLKQLAGKSVDAFDSDDRYTKLLEGGLARLYHTNSYDYLQFLQSLFANNFNVDLKSEREKKFMLMFYYTIWLNTIDKVNTEYSKSFASIQDAITSLREYHWMIEELQTLIDIRLASLSKTTRWFEVVEGSEIELYGCYSADEIHLLLEGKPGRWQVLGTQYNKDKKFAMVFVTLNKSDKEYSPSTLYEDYAISQSQFHWQSMNKTRAKSAEGQRIITQRNNGWKYILFVRDSKADEFGNTNGYYCLGTMDFNSCHGECPMNVIWDMHEPIPGFILESAKAI
jgi:superfamily II DNA or RNA helicase/HKD family nuclease